MCLLFIYVSFSLFMVACVIGSVNMCLFYVLVGGKGLVCVFYVFYVSLCVSMYLFCVIGSE